MATETNSPAVLKTWMRGCAIAMAALGVYVLLSGSFSWWRLLLAALLLACPVLTVWLGWTYARPWPRLHPFKQNRREGDQP